MGCVQSGPHPYLKHQHFLQEVSAAITEDGRLWVPGFGSRQRLSQEPKSNPPLPSSRATPEIPGYEEEKEREEGRVAPSAPAESGDAFHAQLQRLMEEKQREIDSLRRQLQSASHPCASSSVAESPTHPHSPNGEGAPAPPSSAPSQIPTAPT
eukprot:RCo000307